MGKKYLSIIILILLVGGIVGSGYFSSLPPVSQKKISIAVSPYPKQQNIDQISYKGKKGIDALTLLKDHALVEQDASGLVTSIGGRVADPKLHEYWAFYVNGKIASVGPAQYKTKASDTITWKIEKY